MNIITGYVDKYSQNSDGTFSCSIINGIFPDELLFDKVLILDKSSFLTLLSKYNNYSETNTKIITMNCIGIVNSNKIESSNNPYQTIIMSKDNNYIFYPIKDNNVLLHDQFIRMYLLIYTIITHDTKIPDFFVYMIILEYYMQYKVPNPDSTYNSIPDSKEGLKFSYGLYLLSKNPPKELLNVISDKSKYNDLSLYFLEIYNYDNAANQDGGHGMIPDKLCLDIKSPSVLPMAINIDCRNVKDGTPLINPGDWGTMLLIIIGVVVFMICISCICCIISSYYIFKKVNNRKGAGK